MSKMSELSDAVAELRRCGEALIGVSESSAACSAETRGGRIVRSGARERGNALRDAGAGARRAG
jgi:hypothetical protein